MVFRPNIATGSKVPIYKQIVNQVIRSVVNGQLKSGDSLPSTRQLASDLVVNPNTVAKSYTELLREGVIEAQQGKGYFIKEPKQIFSDEERKRRLNASWQQFLDEAVLLNYSKDEIKAVIQRYFDEKKDLI